MAMPARHPGDETAPRSKLRGAFNRGRKWISERGATRWLRKRQSGVREWLVFLVAVAAGIFGYIQIVDERNARHHDEQVAAAAARREQAEQISAWPASGQEAETVILSNRSEQPVYSAIVSRVLVQGAGPHTGRQLMKLGRVGRQEQQDFGVIPPGEYRIHFPGGVGGMSTSFGIELAFQDRAGVNWVRRATGKLYEIEQTTPDYYGLPLPLNWAIPPPAH